MDNLFAIPNIETQSRSKIKAFQEQKLEEMLTYLQEKSVFYQRHFEQNNIDVSTIKSIEDLSKIPPVNKDVLQENNTDFFCIERTKIIDYVTTSGTTGKPVTVALSEKDLDRLGYNEAISMVCADGKKDDIYQLMTTIDRRFMAGLAYFLGVRQLGNGIVRVGAGIPQLQLDSISRIQPNTLIAVPSFIVKLIDYAAKVNFDLSTTSIQKIVCIGEPIRNEDFSYNALGQRIVENWKVELYSTYASTEMATAFTECIAQNGGHEHPELIITELLDENNNVVEDGEIGELTITTLGVEGMPLLRFKTGDIVRKHTAACTCGRNTARLSPVIGRKKQMIKYKGTTLYPPAIFDVLNNMTAIEDYVVEVKLNDINTDEILIYIFTKENDTKSLQEIAENQLRARLRVKPSIQFINKEELQKLQIDASKRKPNKFLDNR